MSVWHRGCKPRRSGTQNSDVTLILQGENSVIMKEGFKYSSDGNNNSFKALSDDCLELELNNAIDKITNYFGTKVKDPAGTYQYDKNGNIIYDPTKAMTFEYNHFNLPYSVEDIHKKTIEWVYTADGRKLKKLSFGSPEKKYLGNMEFVDGTLEAVYHSEGQVAIDGTSQEWRYAISDHLGNRRILMDDANVILSESHYYPFGLEMYGTWNSNSTFPDDSPENDYKYNGKELNGELGLRLYDYGARFYDPAIGRFPSVDRFAGKFTHQSSYAYAANNPIKFIDVNGDSIKIGNETYMPNQGYEGDDNFIKSAFMALDYLYNNGADLSGVICDLACSEETVEIKENTKENNPFIKNAGMQTYFDSNHESGGDPYIIWSDRGGLEFDTKTGWGQILFGDIGKRSPAEGLLHELAHAQSFLKNRSQHIIDSKTPVRNYTNREEYDVINQIENPASEALRGEEHIGRYRHSGRFYRTVSPTSTEKEKK